MGKFSFTAIAVLPALLHYWHPQNQLTQTLICLQSFEEKGFGGGKERTIMVGKKFDSATDF